MQQATDDKANIVVDEMYEAWPIKRIKDRNSGNIVGWFYEWNTGEQGPLWIKERCTDIVFEPIAIPTDCKKSKSLTGS